jgi:pimeloyl-ACP methyl ester carboxylesterase
MIHGVNGLDVHILEAGYESPGRPLALLLHGFPDLAYGWRHLIPILADAGYHVVAPDQRGFGRTTGWVNGYDAQLEPFSLLNMTRDALGLVSALGYRRTAMLVGHDLGSPVAAYCALARPDVFPSVVLMSAPFPGPPALPFNTAESEASSVQPNTENQKLAAALAALDPPREYYLQYLSTREANYDMWHPPQGLHAFLRAFFYVKSADWPGNKPHPLKARTAIEFAQMPTYYVMDLGKTMPRTVAPFQPSEAEVLASKWLTEPELGVYTEEYGRTGFQGALQAYPSGKAFSRSIMFLLCQFSGVYLAAKNSANNSDRPLSPACKKYLKRFRSKPDIFLSSLSYASLNSLPREGYPASQSTACPSSCRTDWVAKSLF